jgi:hypothetical protein
VKTSQQTSRKGVLKEYKHALKQLLHSVLGENTFSTASKERDCRGENAAML